MNSFHMKFTWFFRVILTLFETSNRFLVWKIFTKINYHSNCAKYNSFFFNFSVAFISRRWRLRLKTFNLLRQKKKKQKYYKVMHTLVSLISKTNFVHLFWEEKILFLFRCLSLSFLAIVSLFNLSLRSMDDYSTKRLCIFISSTR